MKEKYLISEKERKIFEKVFTKRTYEIIEKLCNQEHFKEIQSIISSGKEANVYKAKTKQGFVAIKIYKIETSNFKDMEKYLIGDTRFKSVKKTKKEIINAWAKKEFDNLERSFKAKARVPKPITVRENVLIMEFIGVKGIASKTLRESNLSEFNLKEIYEKLIESYARMLFIGKIIHSDLSEYNILMKEKTPIIIDIGQAVLESHANAKKFFERDIKNLVKFFKGKGLKIDELITKTKIMNWKKKLIN